MSRRRRKHAALLGLVCLGGAGRASAQEAAPRGQADPRLTVDWTAPAECPSRAILLARVGSLIGPPRGRHDRTISARGNITSRRNVREPRYRLDLVVKGSEANARRLGDDDCSRLVDAAALILALDINPELLLQDEGRGVPGDARPPPDAEPERAAGIDSVVNAEEKALPKASVVRLGPSPLPSRRARLDLHAGARMVLDEGDLPRTALGAGPFVGLSRGPWAIEAQATFFREQFTVAGPRGGSAGAYVSLWTFSGHACLRELAALADLRACLGGELGIASTTGVSLELSETARGLWTAATATLSARVFHAHTISPTVGVSFVRPFGAPTVYIERFGTVFEPAPIGVRGFLGLDVRFF